MANKKISALNPATTLAGTEELPIVQSSVTVKATIDDIVDYNHISSGEPEYSTALSDTYEPFAKVLENVGTLLAQSSDGRYVYAKSGWNFYKSIDYGKTFSEIFSFDEDVKTLICSDDGKYVYYGEQSNDVLYRSSDYGATFIFTGLVTGTNIPAISADGQYVLVNDQNSSAVLSSNYGVSFGVIDFGNGATAFETTPCMSKNGRYMFGVTTENTVLNYSSDFGATWTEQAQSFSPTAMKCSDSGQYLIATDGTYLWISNDYGVSWVSTTYRYTSTSLILADISSNGKYIFIKDQFSNKYWLSDNYGSTFTEKTSLFPDNIAYLILSDNGKEMYFSSDGEPQMLYVTDFLISTLVTSYTNSLYANSDLSIIYASDGTDLYRSYKKNILTITPTTAVDEVVVVQGGVSYPIARPYKVYTALLTQTGTNAPVATVLENTIGNIVWTRNGEGDYSGTLTGAFLINKTFIIFPSGNETYLTFMYSRGSDNVISLQSVLPNISEGSGFDGFNYQPIEIRVYP